jgi:hypothetical protein
LLGFLNKAATLILFLPSNIIYVLELQQPDNITSVQFYIVDCCKMLTTESSAADNHADSYTIFIYKMYAYGMKEISCHSRSVIK